LCPEGCYRNKLSSEGRNGLATWENRTGLKTRHYNRRRREISLSNKHRGTAEKNTGLKTRHYNGGRRETYSDFQGADQEVAEVARLIQSMVWEPE